ncbi:hypothetical protein AX14_012079 [Amanita brunnescens Koide BX004]|nr:hypothetical protein AX14_012079 [Amanita brunnescens Koide BX004]
MSDQNAQERKLADFIAQDPQAIYTFDSERGSSMSELCRETGSSGRDCITLQMQSTRLFQAMQAQGFFCALPMDPARTYIECKPLPK